MDLQSIARRLQSSKELVIREIVLDNAQKKNQIIYGARAINSQLPAYLRKKTSDYDILTNKPMKSAKELAIELNRRLHNEEFKVVKAKHKGTYKIKDSQGKTIVDYTQLKRKPKSIKYYGNSFYDLKSIKKNINRSLKNPKNYFRKEKDLDSLRRIKYSFESNLF